MTGSASAAPEWKPHGGGGSGGGVAAGRPWVKPDHGELIAWARRGVILLNTVTSSSSLECRASARDRRHRHRAPPWRRLRERAAPSSCVLLPSPNACCHTAVVQPSGNRRI